MIDPSVSVPIAAGASPIATAVALPDDEPHGVRVGSQGFSVCPPTALQPLKELDDRMLAHSDRLALPRMTAPFVRRRATSGASRPGALAIRASDPAVVGMSAVSMLSLIRTGRPFSGPRGMAIGASPCAAGARAITAANGCSVALSADRARAIEPSIALRAGNVPSTTAAAVGG